MWILLLLLAPQLRAASVVPPTSFLDRAMHCEAHPPPGQPVDAPPFLEVVQGLESLDTGTFARAVGDDATLSRLQRQVRVRRLASGAAMVGLGALGWVTLHADEDAVVVGGTTACGVGVVTAGSILLFPSSLRMGVGAHYTVDQVRPLVERYNADLWQEVAPNQPYPGTRHGCWGPGQDPPPETPPEETDPLLGRRIHWTEAKVKSRVNPDFPRDAYPLGMTEARCEVQLTIDEQGVPVAITLTSCPEPFRQATLDAAWQWRFYPVKVKGVPTRATFDLRFVYRQK